MIDHNIVVVNGKEYKAVKDARLNSCYDCAINKISPNPCGNILCEENTRSDNKNVIFKPHHRPKASELKW